jgi:SNF family Na+-dependent transporter
MGTPWMGFMRDEYGWGRNKGALSFGFLTLCLGLPCVIFYQYGFFDQYDYWAGTVSLVIFALAETLLFAWVFGIDKGWKEINDEADIKIPAIFKWVIKYITPLLLIFVFIGALFTPEGNNWLDAFNQLISGQGWPLNNSSLIMQLNNSELKQNLAEATDANQVTTITNQIFFANMARLILVLLFAGIALLVYIAYRKRTKKSS